MNFDQTAWMPPRTRVLATCSPIDATALIVPGGTPNNLDSTQNGSTPKDNVTNSRTCIYTSPAIATLIPNHAMTCIYTSPAIETLIPNHANLMTFLEKNSTPARHTTIAIAVQHISRGGANSSFSIVNRMIITVVYVRPVVIYSTYNGIHNPTSFTLLYLSN